MADQRTGPNPSPVDQIEGDGETARALAPRGDDRELALDDEIEVHRHGPAGREGDQDQAATLAQEAHARGHGVRRAGALDDDVDAEAVASAGDRVPLRRDIERCGPLDAELASQGEAGGVPGQAGNRDCRSPLEGNLCHQQPDRARSDDNDRLARLYGPPLDDRADGNGERLCERTGHEVHAGWQGMDPGRRDGDEFGQAAGGRGADRRALRAQVLVAGSAVRALPAEGRVGLGRHPLADGDGRGRPRRDGGNDTGQLMAEHERWPDGHGAMGDVYVRPAQRGGSDGQEDLAALKNGLGQVLELDAAGPGRCLDESLHSD